MAKCFRFRERRSKNDENQSSHPISGQLPVILIRSLVAFLPAVSAIGFCSGGAFGLGKAFPAFLSS